MNEPTRPWGQPPPPDFPRGESEPIQRGRYRRPSESGYTKGSWWLGHLGEVVGLIVGALAGLVFGAVFGGFLATVATGRSDSAATISGAAIIIGALVGAVVLRRLFVGRR
jgi:hypothetical protein